jgi:glutathione S-transferase
MSHRLENSRAHRILWLLEELGLEYTMKRFKRDANMLADPALRKIHPLGKAPVITIETPGADKPLVLAESGPMIEYLLGYYGQHMIPQRYKDGVEPGPGKETEEWLRDRYFMHYVEGSLMSIMLVALVVNST